MAGAGRGKDAVLKFFGGGKVDHPMADPKRAREIVDEMPAHDAAKCCEEIVYWLDSINQTDGFKLDRRFELIDMIDAAAKNPTRKLSQEYLAIKGNVKFQENKIWNSVFGVWRQMGDAYLKCVAQCEGSASTSLSIRKTLPVLVARGLRALTLQLKWALMRYGPLDPRIWSEICRLYQTAEAAGFAGTQVAIYPGKHGGGSAQQEFLKAVMLSASSTDSLTTVRQELAERAVAHFSGAFVIARAPSTGCNYCVDLAASRPPARLAKGADVLPSQRFCGAGEAIAHLDQLIGSVTETGVVPADVNLGGSYAKEVVLNVLWHLRMYWSDEPPTRASERRRTAASITVVPGFTEILQTIDPSTGDDLDFSQGSSAETWIIDNVSDGGYGAIVPNGKSEWVRVGGLIGVHSETSKYWGVGLIRRVTRDEHQQRRVGVQIVTRAAIPIKLGRPSTASNIHALRTADPGILLATAPDKQGEVGVIMREGIYNGRDSLEMGVNNKSFLLMPSGMVEGGEDYDWAKFKVMQRSA